MIRVVQRDVYRPDLRPMGARVSIRRRTPRPEWWRRAEIGGLHTESLAQSPEHGHEHAFQPARHHLPEVLNGVPWLRGDAAMG